MPASMLCFLVKSWNAVKDCPGKGKGRMRLKNALYCLKMVERVHGERCPVWRYISQAVSNIAITVVIFFNRKKKYKFTVFLRLIWIWQLITNIAWWVIDAGSACSTYRTAVAATACVDGWWPRNLFEQLELEMEQQATDSKRYVGDELVTRCSFLLLGNFETFNYHTSVSAE